MEPITRTISISAAIMCAALFLAPSNASSDGLSDFLSKFNPNDPCDWSGVYFGLNVGGTWNHFDIGDQRSDVDLAHQFYDLLNGGEEDGDGVEGEASTFISFHAPGHDDTQGRAIGGMQTGVNLQFGHFVFGAEGSFIGNVSETTKKFQGFQENEIFLITEEQFVTAETLFTSWRTAETNWAGFIGGRIGWCWNRFLFYGTGGAAFTDLQIESMNRADTAFFGFIGDGDAIALASHTKTTQVADKHAVSQQQGSFLGEIVNNKNRTETDLLTGYYGGVGTEYKLTNNVSVAMEYRHVDWGDKNGSFAPGPNDGPVFPGDFNVGLTGDQVVLKVNIMVAHFNPFH
jgi:opacity protein-like surface antigen